MFNRKYRSRIWCEQPSKRRVDENTGQLKDVVGVTDVPPFKYNESTGKCKNN